MTGVAVGVMGGRQRRAPGHARRYFFYGTLMDADVRMAVLGHRATMLPVEPARLAGFRRLHMRGACFPVLVPAVGEVIDGILVGGIDSDDERRLLRFEGAAYRRQPVTVDGRWTGRADAWCFLPVSSDLADSRPWDFSRWRRRDRTRYLGRIRRVPVAV